MKKNLLLMLLSIFVFSLGMAQLPVPYSYFPFDVLSDGDEMGNIDAEYNGETEIVDDEDRGEVVYFPGGGSADINYIDLSPDAWGMSSEITYCMWVKFESIETWARVFEAGTQDNGSGANEIWFAASNGRLGNNLSFTIDFDYLQGPELDCGFNAEIGIWYHICFGLNDQTAYVWIDGELIGEVDHNSGDPSEISVPNVYLGKSVWADPLLNGYIDDFVIYDKLLSDDDVAALYDGEDPNPPQSVKDIATVLKPILYTKSGSIYIENAQQFDIQSVKISNIAGQVLYQSNKFENYIDANLSSDIYIVSIVSDKGTFNEKIFVQ